MRDHNLRLVVLISGNGSNLQAIIDAIEAKKLAAKILLVISNRNNAFGLVRAKIANIPNILLDTKDFPSKDNFEEKLRSTIDYLSPDLIVLAGFMQILSNAFVEYYYGRIINIHPSLLPTYKGLETHQRVLAAKDKVHGASIHFVTQTLDGGPLIANTKLEVFAEDTTDSLKARVLTLEHKLYPLILEWFAKNRIKLCKAGVRFDGNLLPTEGLTVSFDLSKKADRDI